ncbi:MAG: hypothetical protein OWT28_10175 [Firmicutes bacterium]|nr:hypothetical protein [Bacillota bacterium]
MAIAIKRGLRLCVLLVGSLFGDSSAPSAQAAAQANITISTRIHVQATPFPTVTVTTSSGRILLIEPFQTYVSVKSPEERHVNVYVLFGMTPNQLPLLEALQKRHPDSQLFIALSQPLGGRHDSHTAFEPFVLDRILTQHAVSVREFGLLSVTPLAETSEHLSRCAIIRLQMPHVSLGVAYPARIPSVHELSEEDEILILHPDVLPYLDHSIALASIDPDMAIVMATRRQVMATQKGESAIETLREWWIDVYTIEGKGMDISAGQHGVLLPSTRPVR